MTDVEPECIGCFSIDDVTYAPHDSMSVLWGETEPVWACAHCRRIWAEEV